MAGASAASRLSTYPGGRGGRERAAKRSSDRPRGAEPPAPDQLYTSTILLERAEPPAPDQLYTSTILLERAEPPAPDYHPVFPFKTLS